MKFTVTIEPDDELIELLKSLLNKEDPPVDYLLEESWKTLEAWGVGINGTAGQELVPNGVKLWIADTQASTQGFGSRLFSIYPDKRWKTFEPNVQIDYTLTIPTNFVIDQGSGKFMSMGIQCKDEPNGNALWATNVETINGQLTPWIWHRERGVMKGDLGVYKIGEPNKCSMKILLDGIEFTLNGKSLKVTGKTGANVSGWGPLIYSNGVSRAEIIIGKLTVKKLSF